LSKKKQPPTTTPTTTPSDEHVTEAQKPDEGEAQAAASRATAAPGEELEPQKAKMRSGLLTCWYCGALVDEPPSDEKPIALCRNGHANTKPTPGGRRALVLEGWRWQKVFDALRSGASKRDAFEAAGISEARGHGFVARGRKERQRLAVLEQDAEPQPSEEPYLRFADLVEGTFHEEKLDLILTIREAAETDPEAAKFLLQLRWRDEYREPTGEVEAFKEQVIEALTDAALEFIPPEAVSRFTARLFDVARALTSPGTGSRGGREEPPRDAEASPAPGGRAPGPH
jgi:hypothetical protein